MRRQQTLSLSLCVFVYMHHSYGRRGKICREPRKARKSSSWRGANEKMKIASHALALKSNQPINNQACVYYYYYYYNVCESERKVIPSSCAAAGTLRLFTLCINVCSASFELDRN